MGATTPPGKLSLQGQRRNASQQWPRRCPEVEDNRTSMQQQAGSNSISMAMQWLPKKCWSSSYYTQEHQSNISYPHGLLSSCSHMDGSIDGIQIHA
ncbi:hypothetical protein BAE44_0002087 [Dichanthelium oligosanthes]|uniref:Uncharacterized protein n=1 Tax=Dichanthelium oligosanthes TaxID=888268 RepID=A0A1E5WHM3_9POAL|nr:hypothetical protein BAE44_0002087 [Dichanthelium oligosanthes]